MAVLAGGLAMVNALPALAEELNPSPAPQAPAPLAVAVGEPATSAAGTAGLAMPMKLTEEQKDALIQSLSERLDEALRRLDKLEANQKEATPTPPATPNASRIPGTSATYIPNISIIGNLVARGGDTKATPGRGRSHFEELEIAFQDAVAPNLRYDIHLAAEKEEEWTVALEEGYLTATALMKGLNARAGRIRTPFGKFNRLHPHSWPFITQPAAHTALVGEHGLISDGAVFEYLLPIRGLYANLEFGAWQTTGLHHEHEEEGEDEEGGFVGGEYGAYSARLALAKSLGRDNELELGFSRYWGRGDVHDLGHRMLALNGVDLTFRRYGQGYKRWLFQTEFLAHETRGVFGETKFRPGAFATLAHRWSKFWEAGLRLDYTQFPYPIEGSTYGGSLFLTRFLTEQTSLRLEYRHANDREFGPGNSIFFQVLYGSGPHQHNLQ